MVKPHSVAHILQVEGADPERDRVNLDIDGVRSIVIAVPDAAQAVEVAVELVEHEVAMIELDGGFGTTGAARVVEAVGGRVPVGAVSFGAESLGPASDFVARYDA